MTDREQLELLCSKALDDETRSANEPPVLTPAEREQLDAALKADPDLGRVMGELRQVHADLLAVAAADRLPQATRRALEGGLGPPGPVFSFYRRPLFAAAASLVFVLALLFAGIAFLPERAPQSVGPVLQAPAPGVELLAFSRSPLEVEDANGRVRRASEFHRQMAGPLIVRAPLDTHAVVQLGRGTAVLGPGASARLEALDADGILDVEPLGGDVYLESWARSRVRSTVGQVPVSVEHGGVKLQRTDGGYRAVPAYGSAMVGGQSVAYRQCADITAGNVLVEACEPEALQDWVIAGRADAIKGHVRTLLGERYERIEPAQWERADRLLRGLLSRPPERASYAHMLRLLLRFGFLDEATESELEAWGAIADILAEGTSQADIPPRVLEFFHRIEQRLEQEPEKVEEYKQLLRRMLESPAE
jgi:hypothetical protein